MIVTRKSLPRRTFLRGGAAVLALPFLDAMAPALTAQARSAARPIRRLGFVYFGMGNDANAAKWEERWTPKGEGKIEQLSPSLTSLQPYLDQINVISNLENRNAGVAAGFHATANSCFLACTAAKRTEGSDIRSATTIDQLIARSIGRDTPLPSLELGTDIIAQVGDCDSGYACAYMNNLSWTSPTTPLPTEADPRVVFERLFGDGGTPEQRQAQFKSDASVLDWLAADMARLKRELGASDRVSLDDYVESVREVERRIQIAEQQGGGRDLPVLERPSSVPATWDEHVRLMFDLQALALRADITRVITFQLVREGSTRTYPQIGVAEPHHATSHHSNDPEKLAKVAAMNAYHTSLFAYFLDKLKSAPDGDGSVLDHSLYVFGSGMGNPSVHDHKNLPIVLAGGAAGKLQGGRHIRLAKPTPLSNLWLSVADKLGVSVEEFGDSTGRVSEVGGALNV